MPKHSSARSGSVSMVGLGLCLLAAQSGVQAQTSSVNGVYAIVGARIEIGNGKIIEKGTVLLRDGLIEAVGANVKVPPEAEIIKGDGLTVYPGFIDTHVIRGVTPPDAVATPDPSYDTTNGAPPYMREANRKGIRPELRAGDYLTLTDDITRPARASGFTTELIMPSGGTINGTGALVNLNGLGRRDTLLRPGIAMSFTFRTASNAAAPGDFAAPRGYPGSLMGIMALTRQTLLDAQYYQTLETAFTKGGSRRAPADESLLALQPVLNGTLPVLFDADSDNEIHRAMKMADEFGFKLMVSGGAEAYKSAGVLAQRKIPVLVSLNFGPEPGVIAPTFGPAAGAGGRGGAGGRPGGGAGAGAGAGGRTGRRNRPPQDTTAPPPQADESDAVAAPPAAPPTTTTAPPTTQPATNEKPGQQQGQATPPKPQTEDAVAPNTAPNQANRPAGPTADNAEDENAGVPKVVIQERHAKWEEKVANAAKLNQAGVPFAFTTKGVRSQTEFLTNLRRAIKAGLPREAALRALTFGAAQLMGVDRQMGTIEPGKTAAIVVMSGDFVLPATRVRYLFIDKNKFEPDRDQGPLPALPRRQFGEDDDHE